MKTNYKPPFDKIVYMCNHNLADEHIMRWVHIHWKEFEPEEQESIKSDPENWLRACKNMAEMSKCAEDAYDENPAAELRVFLRPHVERLAEVAGTELADFVFGKLGIGKSSPIGRDKGTSSGTGKSSADDDTIL